MIPCGRCLRYLLRLQVFLCALVILAGCGGLVKQRAHKGVKASDNPKVFIVLMDSLKISF